jgi:hypothetical protein
MPRDAFHTVVGRLNSVISTSVIFTNRRKKRELEVILSPRSIIPIKNECFYKE